MIIEFDKSFEKTICFNLFFGVSPQTPLTLLSSTQKSKQAFGSAQAPNFSHR
jgi:hypothetical protein